jgi:hypothetical protein
MELRKNNGPLKWCMITLVVVFLAVFLLLARGHHEHVDVGLAAAIVVGIASLHPVARSPFVEASPRLHVIDVLLFAWVEFDEFHQSLEIHASSPQVAGSLLLYECRFRGIGILADEIVVGAVHRFQYIGARWQLLGVGRHE